MEFRHAPSLAPARLGTRSPSLVPLRFLRHAGHSSSLASRQYSRGFLFPQLQRSSLSLNRSQRQPNTVNLTRS
ncbi:hypothetical protein EJB05_18758, partial [Eragrostis curvula]